MDHLGRSPFYLTRAYYEGTTTTFSFIFRLDEVAVCRWIGIGEQMRLLDAFNGHRECAPLVGENEPLHTRQACHACPQLSVIVREECCVVPGAR